MRAVFVAIVVIIIIIIIIIMTVYTYRCHTKASQTWGGKRNPGALNGKTNTHTKKKKNNNNNKKPKMTIYISIYS